MKHLSVHRLNIEIVYLDVETIWVNKCNAYTQNFIKNLNVLFNILHNFYTKVRYRLIKSVEEKFVSLLGSNFHCFHCSLLVKKISRI